VEADAAAHHGGLRVRGVVVVRIARFQIRLSMSPKMWQLAQDASPLPEVRAAS